MSDYLFYGDELYHAEKGYVKPDHKYIKREPKGDGYRYYYEDVKTSAKNAAKDHVKLVDNRTDLQASKKEFEAMQDQIYKEHDPTYLTEAERKAAREKDLQNVQKNIENSAKTFADPKMRYYIQHPEKYVWDKIMEWAKKKK